MRTLITAAAFAAALTATAQQTRKDIEMEPLRAASNYYAYPGPAQTALTPAPEGYEPFYISHYGRHGSRYHIGKGTYDKPYNTLAKADSLGKLSPLGRKTLATVAALRKESHLRLGELTELGALQHRQIAGRMYDRFPGVFAGNVRIEARSTTVVRCILSMENALHELLRRNPGLEIFHDASQHDMYYMNDERPEFYRAAYTPEATKALADFKKAHRNPQRMAASLFADAGYLRDSVDAQALYSQLFDLAANIQSSEIRHTADLFGLFTQGEIYDNWLVANASWYVGYGHCPLNGAGQPFSQRNLLRNIIHTADSCIALPHPGATLRFGHEICVLPLACLLELDNCGERIADLEQLDDRGWANYRIFPMGCNIQLVFYRNPAAPGDILVKALLNENEATLPLPADRAPYYRWSDFRKYFTDKLGDN